MKQLWGYLITKRTYAEIYEDYKELFKEDELDEPILLKWAIAAEFCNDLSVAQGLQPCYYLNGEVVDGRKGNYDIRGIGYECRIKNNGWRLPPYKEIKHILIKNTMRVGNNWLWTNDEFKWMGSRIIIRANLEYAAKKFEKLFGWDPNTGIFAYDTDAISSDTEEKLAFIPIRTMYKDDFEKK